MSITNPTSFEVRGRMGGITDVVTASITRPNDTDAYTAGDHISTSTSAPTVLTFTSVARIPGGTGLITGATLVDSANQTTKGDFDLLLFDTTFTPDNDNAAFTPSDAELETCLGVISFSGSDAVVGDATSGANGNCLYDGAPFAPIAFKCLGVGRSLYAALVARNAYTPVAQEKFTIRLKVLQD